MPWKQSIEAYLTFTRKERIAILVLITLLLLVFLSPLLFSAKKSGLSSFPADTLWMAALKKTEPAKNNSQNESDNGIYASGPWQNDRSRNGRFMPENTLFYFDPNTITADEWKKLGIREKTIKTIQNYLTKGGRFRKAEDLSKVYGLFEDEYARLAPYISIEKSEPSIVMGETKGPSSPIPSRQRYKAIDINSADTAAFIALPGIGSKLAMRIVSFRDKLGGFYTISQVSETFGLADSVFQKVLPYLMLENPVVRKININTASLDELKAHPYIRYNLANPIIAYRNEHGPYSTIENIKAVMAVTTEVYSRIAPYLTTEK